MKSWFTSALLGLSLAVVGCSKPMPPTFKADKVEIVDADKAGLILKIQGAATNPNSFAIPVKSVTGKLRFRDTETADVTASSASTLAPKGDTPMSIDVKAPWSSVASAIGHAGEPTMTVPFTVEGTAVLDVSGKELSIPFKQTGTVDKGKMIVTIIRHQGLPKLDQGQVPSGGGVSDDIRSRLKDLRIAPNP